MSILLEEIVIVLFGSINCYIVGRYLKFFRVIYADAFSAIITLVLNIIVFFGMILICCILNGIACLFGMSLFGIPDSNLDSIVAALFIVPPFLLVFGILKQRSILGPFFGVSSRGKKEVPPFIEDALLISTLTCLISGVVALIKADSWHMLYILLFLISFILSLVVACKRSMAIGLTILVLSLTIPVVANLIQRHAAYNRASVYDGYKGSSAYGNASKNISSYPVLRGNDVFMNNQAEIISHQDNNPAEGIDWVSSHYLVKGIPDIAVTPQFSPYFICRAAYGDAVYPGRVEGSECKIADRDKEITLKQYDVLVNYGEIMYWVSPQYLNENANPLIKAGYENNRPVYICSAYYEGQSYPGRVVDQECMITINGTVMLLKVFSMLGTANMYAYQPEKMQDNRRLMGYGQVQLSMVGQSISRNMALIYDWKKLDWVSNRVLAGKIPLVAMRAGFESPRDFYICRGFYQGDLYLGRVEQGPVCKIDVQGEEITVSDFAYLVNRQAKLARVDRGMLGGRYQPVQGGYAKNQPLFLCEGFYAGRLYPGESDGSDCKFVVNQNEVRLKHFSMLASDVQPQ